MKLEIEYKTDVTRSIKGDPTAEPPVEEVKVGEYAWKMYNQEGVLAQGGGGENFHGLEISLARGDVELTDAGKAKVQAMELDTKIEVENITDYKFGGGLMPEAHNHDAFKPKKEVPKVPVRAEFTRTEEDKFRWQFMDEVDDLVHFGDGHNFGYMITVIKDRQKTSNDPIVTDEMFDKIKTLPLDEPTSFTLERSREPQTITSDDVGSLDEVLGSSSPSTTA